MNENTLNVLLIEDDKTDAHYIEVLLAGATTVSCVVEWADSLEKGTAQLANGGIDVVLLDLNLPDSTGMETLTTVCKAAPTTPVVVLTGHGDDEVGLEAVRLGAQDYLFKGEVDTNLLVKTLVYAYERNLAEQKLRENEARLRVFTEQVPAIFWTIDEGMRFTSVRGKGLAALGLTDDEVRGMAIPEYFQTTDEDFPPIAMHLKAMAGESSSGVVKWQDHWYQSHVEPLLGPTGEIIGTIGVALDVTEYRQLEQNVEAAQKIQEHLLPDESPNVPGFDIARVCHPAEQCSGDLFDYVPMRDGHIAIVLADAAGHGFGPAIMATTVRSYLRVASMQGKDVHEMVTAANWLLAGETAPDQFVTLFCCQLDPATKSFAYVAAGHQSFHIDVNGKGSVLDSNAMPIGIAEDEVFPLSRWYNIKPGEILLFVTDGVLEAENQDSKQFGRRRTMRIVHENRHEPAARIAELIYEAVREFTKPATQKDDITAVIVKAELGDVNTW